MAESEGEAVCPQCRAARRPGAEFCHRCGQAFAADGPAGVAPARPRPSRSVLVPVLGIGIIAAFGAIAAIALGNLTVGLVIVGAGALAILAVFLPALFDN